MPTLRSISSVLEGSAFEVQGNYVMIGSAADNTVRLEHNSVSAHHAILTVSDGDFKLWDLHSAGGIKVNGKPVVVAYLQDGDQLLLGEVALRFEAGKDGKRATAPPAAVAPPPGKQTSEIVSSTGSATLSRAPQPPSPLELLQTDRAPAERSTTPDDGPRFAPIPPHPVSSPAPAPVIPSAPPSTWTVRDRPTIQAPPLAPLASADPPNAALSGNDREVPPVRAKGIDTAMARRFAWAGIFLGGIAVFVFGFSRSGHIFNFIGLVMIVLGAAALLVNLRFGNLIAPPRKKEEPAARR